MESTQDEVYENTAKPLLDGVLKGYNATVFAYGVSGNWESRSLGHKLTTVLGHRLRQNPHDQR